MKSYSPINYIIIVVYLLAVFAIGLSFSRKKQGGKTFFKGNDGTIPWWVAGVSLVVTLLSPISFLTLAGKSFMTDWEAWLGQLGIFIAVPLTIIWFLPVYKRMKLDTAYEYLERRFDRKLRFLGSSMFIIFQIVRNAIIMYLPAIALAFITHMNIDVLILIFGVIAVIYSAFGGLKAVLWTDFIQGIVLTAGVLFVVFYLIFSVKGGFSQIISTGIASHKFLNTSQMMSVSIFKNGLPIVIVGAGLSTLASYISSQDMVQRYITTDDLGKMKKMTYLNGIMSIIVASLFFFVGTGMFVFYKQNPHLLIAAHATEDKIFASFIVNQLPIGISGLLIAALFAVGQSSLSSGINGIASTWTLDLAKSLKTNFTDEQATRYGKILSFAVGAFSIILAIVFANSHIESMFNFFNGFVGIILGLVGGLFGLGILTKKANTKGAIVGFIVSLVLSVYINYFTKVDFWAYSIINILTVIVVGYIASFFFKDNKATQREDLNKITIYGSLKKNKVNSSN
ncbi:MAG: sodium:solute symporter [Clostridium sp.]|uniref:sodium:solute symporter n=1 Tax=Clostridium sp. TaxID=1506 RepID=UPI003EE711B4